MSPKPSFALDWRIRAHLDRYNNFVATTPAVWAWAARALLEEALMALEQNSEQETLLLSEGDKDHEHSTPQT